MSNIELRLCHTWDECVQCEEVQRRVWDMPDFRDVVPASFLVTAAKNGGLLVGAFDDPRMIGFAFGVLGSEGQGAARRLKHTSHMLGILPEARGTGLAAALKLEQRRHALEQGLDLMTWTYDPLQALNAHLNLTRLGAIARRYSRDTYGVMTDAVNSGLASDRLEVEWYLASPEVAARAQPNRGHATLPPASEVYQVVWNGPFPHIVDEAPITGPALLVEIPADLNALKRADLPLAVEWRARTRSTFERAFAAGYIARHVLRRESPAQAARFFYLLTL